MNNFVSPYITINVAKGIVVYAPANYTVYEYDIESGNGMFSLAGETIHRNYFNETGPEKDHDEQYTPTGNLENIPVCIALGFFGGVTDFCPEHRVENITIPIIKIRTKDAVVYVQPEFEIEYPDEFSFLPKSSRYTASSMYDLIEIYNQTQFNRNKQIFKQ